jgi:hypothetical protein
VSQMVCGHRNSTGGPICARDVRRVFVGSTELWGHETRLANGDSHYVIPVPAAERPARSVPVPGRTFGEGGPLSGRSSPAS